MSDNPKKLQDENPGDGSSSKPSEDDASQDRLADSIRGFIENGGNNADPQDGEKIEPESGFTRKFLLTRGKVFFTVKAYKAAIEDFKAADDLGSYQGKFLLGLTMTEDQENDYFSGLDHMVEAATNMLAGEYLELLLHALETGERRGFVKPPEKLPKNVHGSLIGEIALTLNLLKDVEPGDEQKAHLFSKLLGLLHRYTAN